MKPTLAILACLLLAGCQESCADYEGDAYVAETTRVVTRAERRQQAERRRSKGPWRGGDHGDHVDSRRLYEGTPGHSEGTAD